MSEDRHVDGDGGDGRDPFEELDATAGIADDEDLEELFTSVEVDPLDPEAVWEELDDGEAASEHGLLGGSAGIEEAALGGEDDGTAPTDDGPPGEAVVPKAAYCHRCEFFSEPPEVTCGNPGTEIVEVVGAEEFRLRDCPVVARRVDRTRNLFE